MKELKFKEIKNVYGGLLSSERFIIDIKASAIEKPLGLRWFII